MALKCEFCRSELVWIGSMKDGGLGCQLCAAMSAAGRVSFTVKGRDPNIVVEPKKSPREILHEAMEKAFGRYAQQANGQQADTCNLRALDDYEEAIVHGIKIVRIGWDYGQ